MRIFATVLLTALALPSAASAGYFQGAAIDTTPDILRVSDLDIAHDGTGAVAYVRRDGGAEHVFVSRMLNGVFGPPERLDSSLAGPGSQPSVAVSDGGRTSVVFVNGGNVYATTRQAGGTAFTQPQLLGPGSDPSADMTISGVGYASYTSGGDVHVARVERGTTQYSGVGGALDLTPANAAGQGAGRSHLSASADGSAIVVWGENGRIGVRRVYKDHLASAGLDITAASVDGHAGGAADSPWIDVEDDSSFAWVVYREQLNDGRFHSIIRRIVGSVAGAPVSADGLGYGGDASASARVQINGRGEGIVTSGSGAFASFAALIHDDKPFPATQISGANAVSPQPVGAEAENNDAFAAWLQGTPVAATVHAVSFDISLADRGVPGAQGDTQLSSDALGRVDPAAGLDLAVDRVGDMAAAFVQDDGVNRRVVVGGFARDPGAFTTHSVSQWRRYRKPPLSWTAPIGLWGFSYDVQIDGQSVAKTNATTIKVPVVVADGEHQWQVIATDAHGQQTASPSRTLRVDATPPEVAFKVSGSRKAGSAVKVKARAADGSFDSPAGSGVVAVSISFGDGARAAKRTATHRYRRGGRFTIKVVATDKAGNKGVLTRRVRIKR